MNAGPPRARWKDERALTVAPWLAVLRLAAVLAGDHAGPLLVVRAP